MKFKLFNKFQPQTLQKSVVLMYHRIASPDSDVWEIAVSADRFEQQLKVLQKKMRIVSLLELIDTSHRFGNMAAITFDDGYIDNFEVAKPILEKYQIPATLFITSKQTEINQVYWWDVLEKCILFTEQLPPVFELVDNNSSLIFNLREETLLTDQLVNSHCNWKASTQSPPTLRAKLFLALWQYLKALPHTFQEQYLYKIKSWAGFNDASAADYRVLPAAALKEFAAISLFTIGAHTATHPALAQHSADFQKKEMSDNKQYLQKTIDHDVNFLAYPYGNFNSDTLTLAWELGFTAAFTTEEKVFDRSNIYKLGRFQVKNITGNEFEAALTKWMK